MIKEYIKKVNSWISANRNDLYVAVIIFLVGLSSFGLGRLSILWPEKEPITIKNQESGIKNQGESLTDSQMSTSSLNSSSLILNSAQGRYVASKNGKAYHFPWCSGALNIKEENKVWFDTKEEAEKAGYKAAANCEGL